MEVDEILTELAQLDLSKFYERDAQDFSNRELPELAAVFAVADALAELRGRNYDLRIFRGGVALCAPEADRLSAAAACALLGLSLVTLDAPPDETALLRAAPDVVFTGAPLGEVCNALYRDGHLRERPLLVATDTSLPLLLSLLHRFGGAGAMRGQTYDLPPSSPPDLPPLTARFDLVPSGATLSGAALKAVEALRPFVLAAFVLLGKSPEPVKLLETLRSRGASRRVI